LRSGWKSWESLACTAPSKQTDARKLKNCQFDS
jgi:hypothetical protein